MRARQSDELPQRAQELPAHRAFRIRGSGLVRRRSKGNLHDPILLNENAAEILEAAIPGHCSLIGCTAMRLGR